MKVAFGRWFPRAMAVFAAAPLWAGCDLRTAPIFDPKGPIARAERDLLFDAFGVMLIIVIPVVVLAVLFVWRYRASNTAARYDPDWSYSARIDAIIWLVPALIIVALGTLLWASTHKLDPYKALASAKAPLEVEVVAQDWKWLFIYPEQKIASVNELVFPSGAPLSLKITSDTVMNAFFIPALGGQIYAMAGMQTRLHLIADAPGRFLGRNTQYSGDGFSEQHFTAIAATRADFDAWVETVRQSPRKLDAAAYRDLAAPSISHPVTHFSAVDPGLFGEIIGKYCRTKCNAAGSATR
jgi:cytochrome o ubiquinol oxidase subunit 2